MISFTKKVWKNRTDPTLAPTDPRINATELGRHEDAIDALVRASNVILDTTLGANSATFDITGLDLTGLWKAKVFANLKLTGTHTPHYGHTFMQFNGDSALAHYAWTVKNSDASTDSLEVISGIGTSLPAVQNSQSLLIGHAPTSDAVAANEWGTHEIDIYLPGFTNNVKNCTVRNQVMTDFSNYFDLKPIEMRGPGFWIGPAAITRLTILPEVNQIAAGSRVIIMGYRY